MKKLVFLLSITLSANYLLAQTREAITVNNWGDLYSGYEISAEDEELIIAQSSQSELEKAKNAHTDAQWPDGIDDLDERLEKRAQLGEYHVYKVATLSSGSVLIVAPAAENKHMPADMKSDKDIYFVLAGSAFATQAVDDLPDLSWLDEEYVATDYSSLTTFDEQFSALLMECETDFENLWGDELFDDATVMEQYDSKLLPEGAGLATITGDYEYNYMFWANYGGFDNQTSGRQAYAKLVAKIDNAKPECCTLTNIGETVTDSLVYTSWTYPGVYIEAQVNKVTDPSDGKIYYDVFLGISRDY